VSLPFPEDTESSLLGLDSLLIIPCLSSFTYTKLVKQCECVCVCVCIYIYIGFKTLFYVVRHLDSTASYLPTGLHLGFFRSWPSLYLPSSFFFGLPRALFCFGIHFNAILSTASNLHIFNDVCEAYLKNSSRDSKGIHSPSETAQFDQSLQLIFHQNRASTDDVLTHSSPASSPWSEMGVE
jgi:hypothetical protein